MKVKATNKSEVLNVAITELGRIAKTGEEFEVTEERYKVLRTNNSYNVPFVEAVIETAVKEEKKETAKKQTTKKKTTKKSK